jgi:uncharacterized protein
MWGKAKGSKQRELRIYFATDLHGSEVCFRKFLAAAKVYEADVIILGGDFAGKAIVPVLTENGSLRTQVGGEDVTVPESEWDRLASDIGKTGLYPVRMEAADLGRLSGDEAELDRLFRREIAAQMQRWCDLAAERLDPAVRCIITPGNDDPVDADPVLAAHPRVECPELELCDLGPVTMASLGVVPTTPWNTERECSEDELAKQIDEMLQQVPSGQPCLLNLHCRRTRRAWTTPQSWTARSSRSSGAGGPASSRSAATRCATRSSATSRWWVCTGTSTNRGERRRSAGRCASTRAATTPPACCAGP